MPFDFDMSVTELKLTFKVNVTITWLCLDVQILQGRFKVRGRIF